MLASGRVTPRCLATAGKVRELYDLGGRPADGRLRPHLHLRRRPPDADPGQGPGAHRALRAVVRADAATSCPTTSSPPPTACRTSSAAARCACSGWRCCRSSASCAATSPARAGRTTRRPARSRASRCRRACRSPSSCRSRSSRRRRRPRRATTRRSTSREPVELVGSRRAGRAAARRLDRGLRGGRRRTRCERGVILADTKFEFGLDARRRADARRRGLHAGLLALLAGRRVRAGPRPAVVRQAVRARLGVRHRLGQDAAGAGDPRRRRRADARALRDRLRAAGRRAVRARGWSARRREGARPDPAQGRDPRPAGPGGRARAAGARLRGRVATSTSAGWSSSTSRTRRGCRRCASSCSPTR